ncbi:MAG: prepilin-type N-terminal cleavage/methylation domain-containing protein [Candidatus Omnitrophota bacterium]|nr:prepilin-type N-terminal cleavage/methylation domain-containing protein [Candidatus Omnitrophota bacterium]
MLYVRKRKDGSIERGFTLPEILFVVALIGMLTVLAFKTMYPAALLSHKNICVINLKNIYHAKTMWAMDNPRLIKEEVAWNDLVPDYLDTRPGCPAGGKYTIGNIRSDPRCSVPGHEL